MFVAGPPPIYAADEPIEALQPSELFVLCLARLWVVHHRDPDVTPAEWRDGFAHMYIDKASEAGFDRLFQLIAARAIRSIDVRCPNCRGLGADEGLLLQLVGLLQSDRPAEAAAILRDWLTPTIVVQAAGAAQVFATGLAARGLSIKLRHPEAARARARSSAPHACSLLVH